MVSQTNSSQKSAIQYIKNKEALVLIVTLFPRCSISLQLEILNKITRLAEQSQRNLETCRSSNLLNTCIELLFRVENDTLFGTESLKSFHTFDMNHVAFTRLDFINFNEFVQINCSN
jgi:hypothetical protein